MGIQIRLLGPADSSQYRAVRLESLRAHPDNFGSTYEEQVKLPKLMFEAAIEQPADSRFVVGSFDNTELVGICGFVPSVSEHFQGLENTGTLIQMYVRGDYRGRKIGLALVNALVAEAFKNPKTEIIVLGVRETNTRAIRVYKEAGFNIYHPKGGRTTPGFQQMIIQRD